MEFLWNKLTEWLKEMLVGGVMSNLTGLFDSINEQVADIAGTVGTTPQAWNSGVFSMVQSLSNNVVVPIAGVLLAIVMAMELIQMVVDRNNMNDFDVGQIVKWVCKSFFAIILVTSTWDIVMGIFDLAQTVVNNAAGVIISDTSLDLNSVITDMEARLMDMDIGPLFSLWIQSALIGILSWILTICIFIIVYGRMIEIYLVTSIAPIPMATMGNREWSQMGQNYLRSLFALGFQAFLIVVCVAVYAVLVQSIAVETDVIKAIWTSIGYTVLLCFTLFKTSSLSRSIFKTEDTIGTGKSLHYHFNDAGNLVSVNDDLGYGYFAGYSDAAPQNHPDYVSKLQYAVNNYLKNHHFITVNDDWLVEKVGGTGECGYSSDNNYIGGRAYKLNKTNSGGYISTYQTVSLETGKNYTLSCQYNTLNEAELQLQIEMPHGTILKTGSAVKCTDRWNRTHLSFNVPKIGSTESKTYADVTVRFMAVGNPGTVWVDAAQLEDGMVPNRYNLLENGNFYMNESGCPQRWTAGVGSNNEECDGVTQEIEPGRPSELAGNVVCLYGKPGKTKIFDQTVPSIGSAGDTFVAGGWSWNHSRPRNDDTPTYYEMEILARPYVSSGVAQFQTVGRVQWSEEWSGWQFAAIPIVIPFRYTDIYVKLLYQDNLNKAQFSNLFLHREEFGNTYDYDDKGNVTSVKNLAALQSGAEYDAFDNLTSYHQPGRSETYTLDWGNTDAKKKQHLLRSTRTPLGIISRTKYDVDTSASGKGLPVANYVENTSDNFYIAGKTEYTENGNYVAKQIDARGKEVITETNTDKGTVTYVKDPKGQQVNYTYDDMKRVKTVETSVVKNNVVNTYKNEYTYTDDKLTRVAHNTTGNDCDVVYTFAYDTQNRRTSVNVGDQQLSRNEYNNTPGNTYGTLARTVFGNDDVVSYTYDEFKRMTEVKYGTNNSQKYSYEYDANGQVARVTNHELGRTVLSEHDLCNRPMRITHMSGNDHLYTGEVTYDVYNNLHSFEERVGAARTQYITNFAYDVENKPTTLSYGSTANRVVYAYDNLGRTASRTVTVGGRSYPTTYTYIAGGVAYDSNNASKSGTTGLIATINQTGGNFTYEYDDNGNIISVVQDGKTTTYEYDALGQLIRVNDPHDTESGVAGTTWMYKYDLGGNITAKKRFAYTAPSITIADDAVALETMTFAYTNAAWKDKLTVFNGKPISYDAIGNPLQVGENNDADKVTYTWEKGRQLASMSKPGTTASFKYNENGLRIQKTVNGVVTDYTLHGKNIVHMTQGSNSLHFFYDASNKPAIVEYNGTKYAYVHNLQGDIVAILDSNSTAVVQYKYDAWGKPISKTGSMASTLGTVQPFRYRGYVYDEETGLYYLRSRYYSHVFTRFLNSDVLYTAYRSQYQYCKNNPVKNSDLNGFSHSDATAKPWYAGLQNRDGSYSLYDNDRFRDNNAFHEQLLVVNVAPPDFDMNDGDLTFVSAEFDFITGGWETDNVDVSLLDLGHAEASFEINVDEGKLSVGAMASVWSPSVSFTLFGCEITLGLEILAVGMQADINLNTTSASYSRGYGLWGWSIELDW